MIARGNALVLLVTVVLLTIMTGGAIAQSKSKGKSPAPSVPAAPPPSAIGKPSPRLPATAQLSSPAITTTTPSSGASARTDKLPSPYPGSNSPSELATSFAGGGGHTLQDCMGFWDRMTHMTKVEWRRACQRVERRLESLKN